MWILIVEDNTISFLQLLSTYGEYDHEYEYNQNININIQADEWTQNMNIMADESNQNININIQADEYNNNINNNIIIWIYPKYKYPGWWIQPKYKYQYPGWPGEGDYHWTSRWHRQVNIGDREDHEEDHDKEDHDEEDHDEEDDHYSNIADDDDEVAALGDIDSALLCS